MPQELADKWSALVSLAPEVVGVPTDNNPVVALTEDLSRLLDDPDAELPNNV
jgi:hypothetical protein